VSAPRIRVLEIERRERVVRLRLPFRFGVVTLTEAPQAFIRARVQREDGREGWGLAAELMVPKWFDKSADLTNEDNFDQLRLALAIYSDLLSANGLETPFGHFAGLYDSHIETCASRGLNPLAAGFGPALIDRAVLDAVCRLDDLSFADAARVNLPGMAPDRLLPEFAGFDFDGFLAGLAPLDSLDARHTVGLVDPLTAEDQTAGEWVGDGLPETLEEVIARYGHRYFKIKVGGDIENDVERLSRIADVLDRAPDPYRVTLDGNEQYRDVDGALALFDAMASEGDLARLVSSILFVEQPIHRDHALETDIASLDGHFPVIIDESDGDLAAFAVARDRGYTGVSSKNCKGFYKSLINLARCRKWSADDGRPYFMSAEDLTCQAGVAVQQDLVLVALLGIPHVERNGHHYVNGMAGATDAEQDRFLAAHPDLYQRIGGRVCAAIRGGRFEIASLRGAGFGTSVEPDWDNMSEMKTPERAGETGEMGNHD